MLNRDKKKKLRKLLANISPEDKGELLIANLEDDVKDISDKLPKNNIEDIRQTLVKLQTNLINKINTLPTKSSLEEIKKNHLENLDSLNKELAELSKKTDSEMSSLDTGNKKTNEDIESLKKEIKKLREETISMLGRGGSMNRKITVDGTDYLTRYTDINLVSGTGALLVPADDNTNKRVNVTFDISAAENLWDRTGTVLSPHTANDSIDIGSGDFDTTGTISGRIHLPAGTATASTAPLKFTTDGTLLTTSEVGTMEFSADNRYFYLTDVESGLLTTIPPRSMVPSIELRDTVDLKIKRLAITPMKPRGIVTRMISGVVNELNW